MPAFLAAALSPSETDLRDATIRDLTPESDFARARLVRRASRVNSDQRRAILAWLEFTMYAEELGADALDFWRALPVPVGG